MNSRLDQLREAASRPHDVVIVGGGINGAGIAHDAAARGLDVVLIDQHDWGFGTTWRSTKLVHGGLRYLEHGEFGLVFESLRERAVLLRTAPHLVRALPFLLPSYRGDRHGLPALRAGLTLYDLLAWGGGLPRHRALSAPRALTAEPGLRPVGLQGGLAYWDCQVEMPERLCIENVLRARDDGATTISYVRAEQIMRVNDRACGVVAVDRFSGAAFEVAGRLVVNAAGPWVDRVLAGGPRRLVGGTRGAHLVVRFPNGGPRHAIYAEAAGDHRPFFVVPWRGVHLVGTTDIRVDDPDELLPSDAEVEYLYEATHHLLPGDPLRVEDLWYAYGGIRPLPYSTGAHAGAITRRHHIIDHRADSAAGLITVVGGKLSTYRSLSAQVADLLVQRLGYGKPSRTADEPLVTGDWQPHQDSIDERRLWRIYGPRAVEVLALQDANPALTRPICPHTVETLAEAAYAIRHEGAVTVADVLLRRTPAGWSRCRGLDAAPAIAAMLVGWSEEAGTEIDLLVAAYEREVARTFRTCF
ncbi:MAG: glycerol-3-phosphate dehydrogenase/oxidase [Dehalococcoidia bacterium]